MDNKQIYVAVSGSEKTSDCFHRILIFSGTEHDKSSLILDASTSPLW